MRQAYWGSIAAVVEATLSGSGELTWKVGWDIEVAMVVDENWAMVSIASVWPALPKEVFLRLCQLRCSSSSSQRFTYAAGISTVLGTVPVPLHVFFGLWPSALHALFGAL